MSGSKVKELRAVAPHVHCFACGCTVRDGEGGTGEVLQPMMMPGQGIGFTGRVVSLCPTCLASAEAQVQQAKQAANARGRLVVARAQVPS